MMCLKSYEKKRIKIKHILKTLFLGEYSIPTPFFKFFARCALRTEALAVIEMVVSNVPKIFYSENQNTKI